MHPIPRWPPRRTRQGKGRVVLVEDAEPTLEAVSALLGLNPAIGRGPGRKLGL